MKSNGAGFTNGIGIELKSIPISNKSVSPADRKLYYLNNNGTEANQTHAVIILTDAKNFLNVLYQSSLQHPLVPQPLE
jgi:hypothetical protein